IRDGHVTGVQTCALPIYTNETLNITGLVARGTYDSYLGSTVDAIQAGNTLTFNVIFTANSYVYQRNLTMGVKFDWMSNFQNTTKIGRASCRERVNTRVVE